MTIPTPEESDLARDARQLALVDRVIGLQAEVANLNVIYPNRINSLEAELRALLASRTWKAGLATVSPMLFARKVLRKIKNRKKA
ncbi:hypothetical protein [Cryobacterium roopkundense]|uniref:DnaJ-domain-containing protein 1 n=1 Tax=Cryobacterium roopkundense TaxID=1001240 RepID=A0A7W8ZXR9_9MICO|nr:hypothetical protein [Cryobacterium roopkundense]MBB5642168.1 DnaJ-domain-containing protein 1 [Cryobacterium roopkundense]